MDTQHQCIHCESQKPDKPPICFAVMAPLRALPLLNLRHRLQLGNTRVCMTISGSFPFPTDQRHGPSPRLHIGTTLPRLNRAFSLAAKAASRAARRNQPPMSEETRRKIVETTARNKAARSQAQRVLQQRQASSNHLLQAFQSAYDSNPFHRVISSSSPTDSTNSSSPEDIQEVSDDVSSSVPQNPTDQTNMVNSAAPARPTNTDVIAADKSVVKIKKSPRRGTKEVLSKARQKETHALKGRKLSEERKRKISAAMKGRKLSPEHRKKLSARFSGKNNPMYGKTLSPESRAKISASMTARKTNHLTSNSSIHVNDDGNDSVNDCNKNNQSSLSSSAKESVMGSRLIKSLQQPPRKASEMQEEALLDDILSRVAAGELPPQDVQRIRAFMRERHGGRFPSSASELTDIWFSSDGADNDPTSEDVFISAAEAVQPSKEMTVIDKKKHGPRPTTKSRATSKKKIKSADVPVKRATDSHSSVCSHCDGTGSIECSNCLGRVGTASRHCEHCVGAGVVFCSTCQGAGVIKGDN